MKKTKAGRQAQDRPQPSHQLPLIATVLVVLALPEERGYFHSVISGRKNWSASTAKSRYICEYASPQGQVDVVVQTLPSMGNIEATLGAATAISLTSPDLVVLVGLAGSLAPSQVMLGDVVISNQAKLYASDKVGVASTPTSPNEYRFSDQPPGADTSVVVDFRDRFMSKSFLRYERKFVESGTTDDIISDAELRFQRNLSFLQSVDPEHVPEEHRQAHASRGQAGLHTGWILASPHVVDSAEYRDYLLQKNTDLSLDIHRQKDEAERVPWKDGSLLALDMESYGLLRAVEKLRTTPDVQGGCSALIGGLVVRGISDLCEEKGRTDRRSSNRVREVAVANATEVCLRIIEQINYRDIVSR